MFLSVSSAISFSLSRFCNFLPSISVRSPRQTPQSDTPMLAILLYMGADQCNSPRRFVVRYAVAENKQINLEPALVQHRYPINHYWYHYAVTQCQTDLHFTARCKQLNVLYSNSLLVSLIEIWLSHESCPYTGLGKPLGWGSQNF
jgi:hypothetical protein